MKKLCIISGAVLLIGCSRPEQMSQAASAEWMDNTLHLSCMKTGEGQEITILPPYTISSESFQRTDVRGTESWTPETGEEWKVIVLEGEEAVSDWSVYSEVDTENASSNPVYHVPGNEVLTKK
ncbi:hypothetical protein [Alkalicoccus urumqiensis]|uniref:Uncharacterized protein n=1 Tax=Alkalicoccus urumqiensis TaxID=1548213 RepID=A0A2P6MFJ3_ALKUR|nr:hypothetical protein [Alkalicoccus urumqiensis]PRO65054.1 hypothetical protein C6I21_11445 [Alkalicoccus urumqiensis]